MAVDADTIRSVMSELGKRTSVRKAEAARRNGRLGGRPLGSKDKRPRKRLLSTLETSISTVNKLVTLPASN